MLLALIFIFTISLFLKDLTYVRRLERLCDSIVQLESFEGSEKEQNPIYKEYHGMKCVDLDS